MHAKLRGLSRKNLYVLLFRRVDKGGHKSRQSNLRFEWCYSIDVIVSLGIKRNA